MLGIAGRGMPRQTAAITTEAAVEAPPPPHRPLTPVVCSFGQSNEQSSDTLPVIPQA